MHLHPFTACHYLYINRSSLLLHDCSPSGRPARFYINSICLRLSSPWTLKSLIACGGCVILWGASLHSHPVAALRSSFPLSLSPRPSAPPSPPNCCLMVQLLRNTLEHGLRDQGYCHGSPSRLNQKKRQKKTKCCNRQFYLPWRIVRNTSLGVCYKGCFPLSPIHVSIAGGLPAASISSSSAASHALISAIAVCLCSVQPTTYSIDWLFFNIYREDLFILRALLCTSGHAVHAVGGRRNLLHFLGCFFLFVCVATSYSHSKMG